MLLAPLLVSCAGFHTLNGPSPSSQMATHRGSVVAQMGNLDEAAARAAWLANNEPAWSPPGGFGGVMAAPYASTDAAEMQDSSWLVVTQAVAQVTLEAADEMANVALREAASRAFNPVSVCVLDAGGRIIVQKTMIGCARLSPDYAKAKANVCIGLHCSSRELRDKYQNDQGIGAKMPQLLAMGTAGAAANQALAPFPGGVLCRDTNLNLVCAIGVSGAASDEDEHCAITAAQSVGLVTEPAASQLG